MSETADTNPATMPDAVSDTGRMRVKALDFAACLKHAFDAGSRQQPWVHYAPDHAAYDRVLATLEPDVGLRGEAERPMEFEARQNVPQGDSLIDTMRAILMVVNQATKHRGNAGKETLFLEAIGIRAKRALATLAPEGQNAEASLRKALIWAMDEIDALSCKLTQWAYPQGMLFADRMEQQEAYAKAVQARRAALASTAPTDTAEVA